MKFRWRRYRLVYSRVTGHDHPLWEHRLPFEWLAKRLAARDIRRSRDNDTRYVLLRQSQHNADFWKPIKRWPIGMAHSR